MFATNTSWITASGWGCQYLGRHSTFQFTRRLCGGQHGLCDDNGQCAPATYGCAVNPLSDCNPEDGPCCFPESPPPTCRAFRLRNAVCKRESSTNDCRQNYQLCDGVNAACPANLYAKPDGTICDGGSFQEESSRWFLVYFHFRFHSRNWNMLWRRVCQVVHVAG